ncbi:MAG: GNAT family N-acetyltransferase [Ornithinimicrobium sp.]
MSEDEKHSDPTYTLVTLSTDDVARMTELEDTVWFEVLPGATPEDVVETFDYTRGRGVEAAPALRTPLSGLDRTPTPLVGIYGAYEMHLSAPGPRATVSRLPMSGLTWVGVHPDHRRRGILTQMMRDHLHRTYADGVEALSGLWAAEVEIYGRYGYGPASLEVMLTLGTGSDLVAPEHLVERTEDISTFTLTAHSPEAARLMHSVHRAAAQTTLGTATRPDSLADLWFHDFPQARGTKEPRRVLFAVRDGEPVGYAVFRRTSEWDEHNVPGGVMSVGEIAAVDPDTLLALSKRLLSFDLISKVKFYARSVDDPLVWWAGGPRSTAMQVTDALWVRLVDLPRAMTERGYGAPCDVVIDVADDICEWNARRWRLSVDAGGVGTCSETHDPADLSLNVAVLGSAYLGGRSVASQAAAGFVTEHRDGAVRELSRAMRADTEPLGTSGF